MKDNGADRANLVTLVDDEGNEHDFAIVDALQIDEKPYAILVPVYCSEDEEDEIEFDPEEDAYIFRVEIDDESSEEVLSEVDDEEEWERVAAAWESRVEALDEDEDEDDDGDYF